MSTFHIAYITNILSRASVSPTMIHLKAAHRVLQYILQTKKKISELLLKRIKILKNYLISKSSVMHLMVIMSILNQH
jgi:hypothetical protein